MRLFSFVYLGKENRMKDITIYTNRDGRTRAYIKGTKKVVSYPRLLLEEKLGRPLDPKEQVHHVDGNPLNNNADNLEVIMIGEHQKHHSTKYFDTEAVCGWCGKRFIWTAVQQRRHVGNMGERKESPPFCSKSCSGSYGRRKQLDAGVAK